MQYKVLVSFEYITTTEHRKLDEAGAVVPYDAQGSNYYIYLPENIDKKEIQHILKFDDTHLTVSEDEVQKQINKIKVVNKFNVGDTVFYFNKYRRLPLLVTEAHSNSYRVWFELKGIVIDEVVNADEISKANNFYTYTPYIHKEKENKLIIDCDSFKLTSDNKINHCNAFILLLIRIKASYVGHTIIVSNPDNVTLYICQVLGLMVSYGKITQLLTEFNHAVCFTTDKTLIEYTDKLAYINIDNQLVEISRDEYEVKYHTDVEVKEDNANGHIIYTNISNINYEKARKLFIAVGLQSMASNIQYLVSELHK